MQKIPLFFFSMVCSLPFSSCQRGCILGKIVAKLRKRTETCGRKTQKVRQNSVVCRTFFNITPCFCGVLFCKDDSRLWPLGCSQKRLLNVISGVSAGGGSGRGGSPRGKPRGSARLRTMHCRHRGMPRRDAARCRGVG